MGRLFDQLQSLVVEAVSPNGMFKATIKGGSFSLSLEREGYEVCGVKTLEHQLERLITLTATYYRRRHRNIMDEAGLIIVLDPRSASSEAQRNYLRDVAELDSVGISPKELITISAVGMRSWKCDINDACLDLDGGAFVKEVEGAFADLYSDYRREVTFLKDEHYDLESRTIRQARLGV